MVMMLRTCSFAAAVFVFGFLADMSFAKRTEKEDMEIGAEESSVNVGVSGDVHDEADSAHMAQGKHTVDAVEHEDSQVSVGVSGDVHEAPSASMTLAQELDRLDGTQDAHQEDEDQVETKLDAEDGKDGEDASSDEDGEDESSLEEDEDQVETKLDAEDGEDGEDASSDEEGEDEEVDEDDKLDKQLEVLQSSLLEDVDDDEEIEGHVSLLDEDLQGPKKAVKIPDDFQYCRSFCVLSIHTGGAKSGDHGTIHYMHRTASFRELVKGRPLCNHAWTRGKRPANPKTKKGQPPYVVPRVGKTTYFHVKGKDMKAVEDKEVPLPAKCQNAIWKHEPKFKLPGTKQCHGDNNAKGDKLLIVTLSNSYGTDALDECKAEWNKFYEEAVLDPKDKVEKKRIKELKNAKKPLLKKAAANTKEEIAIHKAKKKQLKDMELADKKKAKYASLSPAKKKTWDAAEALKEAKMGVKEETRALAAQKKADKKAAADLKKANKAAKDAAD